MNDKSIDGVLGTRTRSSRMVVADQSTELWWQPYQILFGNGTNSNISFNSFRMNIMLFLFQELITF